MQGKIIKGISGFYYIHVAGSGIYECKAKGVFRNQNIKPLVGDNVEIAVLDEEHKKGNIEKVLPRENELIRPAVANIDLAADFPCLHGDVRLQAVHKRRFANSRWSCHRRCFSFQKF